jgi:RNase P subunit RPR2
MTIPTPRKEMMDLMKLSAWDPGCKVCGDRLAIVYSLRIRHQENQLSQVTVKMCKECLKTLKSLILD